MRLKMRSWLRPFGAGLWSGWPQHAYRREHYQHRLAAVQAHFATCLDSAGQGSLRVVSLCAGDGRDVIGVLQSHRRRDDVSAWLIELDRQSVADGRRHVQASGLEKVVQFINADATDYSTYKDFVPCDVILVCGVWGHVPAEERAGLVRGLAAFCKPGGSVVWTRGISKGVSRLEDIQSQFEAASWEQVDVSATPDGSWVVGTHRYRGPSLEAPRTGRIFNFRKNAG
jgi:hypothetical protein